MGLENSAVCRSMSPFPTSFSAPDESRIVRESIMDATENAILPGILAFIRPVITSTLGRCVATIKCMPTARAIWARRIIPVSTSFDAVTIKSASSSIIKTRCGSFVFGCALLYEVISLFPALLNRSKRLSISDTVHFKALTVLCTSVITGVSRCGMPLYSVSSTRFGSIIIMRNVSAVFWYNKLVIIVFMHTVFPEPVDPAIRRWGIFGKSANHTFPPTSFPRPTIILCGRSL